MKNKKVYYSVLVVLLLIFVVSTTYAFFAPQAGGTTSVNATVTSNTTDLLTFSINRDISFTVTQAMFTENGTNQSGDATATATLTPNNKTGAATMNYYLYLNIESNPTVYSEANTNEDPELMLQVFDGNNQLVTLTGLGTQKTINGVTGYDITGAEGLITLLDNHAISATNNTAAIENWRIVITLINLDVNQNDNTGIEIEAELIIGQEKQMFTGTLYRNNTVSAVTGSETKWEITDGTLRLANKYNSQLACTTALTEYNYPQYFYCDEIFGITEGIGNYEISMNAIRMSTYNVYCPIGGDKLTCSNSYYFLTEQDCLNNVYTDIYTCTQCAITKPYYLKHVVENNIIESAEVCLWYNNHEFCLGPNYWDTNETNTKNKLQSEMEMALGIQSDSCYSFSSNANCRFGDFQCGSGANGEVFCFDDSNGSCVVSGDGSSYCE